MGILSISVVLFDQLLKENVMNKFLTLVVAIALLTLVGCNTIKGVGQDIQKAGSVIEDAVKR
jgi:predicted small secreted protein